MPFACSPSLGHERAGISGKASECLEFSRMFRDYHSEDEVPKNQAKSTLHAFSLQVFGVPVTPVKGPKA